MTMALKRWKADKYLYLMALPGMLYFVVFHYFPMWGIVIAFQDYNPFQGVMHSDWIGFEHFSRLFRHPDFWLILRNTLVISLLNIVFFFPAPIVLALLLNEIRTAMFKKSIQTVVYLPHFVSWVVICSMTISLMNSDGLLTKLVHAIGYPKLQLLMDKSLFWGIITVQSIWKDAGWGTIIFLAALAGINPDLYESAKVDGANRWQQTVHITLPCVMNTIVILLILRLGQVMNISFDQLYIMGNPLVKEVAEVFDTYVYQAGVLQGNFSYATAVGIFKSAVGFVLILTANMISKKTSEHYLF
ncbi:ABC transporter permease [Paenibacillus doosanensis]|uniref:ABC transporter permease n=1 Tax=Paenibacillus doosanensis TaxID=1229154 RepID=UPI00217FFE9C|nr:ABC transporter permease subunit [Paenibacillus doosanensis]